MKKQKNWKIETLAVHGALDPENWQGATLPPIFQSAANRHPTAESLTNAFTGKSADPVYMRLTNPTNKALEQKLCLLEGGKAAVVTASGMAAISNATLALLRAGDEIAAGTSLFMSTYLLFTGVFKKYNITARLFDPLDLRALEAAITDKTRLVYLETMGNPRLDVPDLQKAADIAHAAGLPLVVDSTLAGAWLCRPIELGADVVLHSTTKYLSGHGDAAGGAIIDAGTFPWGKGRFEDFAPFVDRKGELAFADRVWREMHINLGPTQAPFHSYLTLLGIDTLALRMERQTRNALALARFLDQHPRVKWTNYPGLAGHPSHETAKKQFGGRGFGAMVTIGLEKGDACQDFINRLRLVYHLANLGDCKTLAIHPWSTQYAAFDEAKRRELGIAQEMIRLSVGIENVEDIMEDLDQALSAT